MEKLTQYVNPNIGTIGHLSTATSPTVMYPHGMMQISPNVNTPRGKRYLAGVLIRGNPQIMALHFYFMRQEPESLQMIDQHIRQFIQLIWNHK